MPTTACSNSTNATAIRNVTQSWYSETTATITKKWKCDSMRPCEK
jgi:hypothetical protein